MPKKLILHLGLHKTATTSLQNFLSQNSKALLAQGARYVQLNRMRSDVTPLISSMAKGDQQALARLMEEFRKPVLLLSDENILGVPGDIFHGELYPFAGNRISKLCEQFSGMEIELFLTLRAPGPFLISMYCEFLRHNAFVSFKTYTRDYDVAGFSYAGIFDWMFSLPRHARVTVRAFEPEHGGGVQSIARAIVEAACAPESGVDFSTFPAAKSRSSFSVEELEVAAGITERADGKTAQFFLNMLEARGRRFGANRFAPLPLETVAALEARYARDLQAFARLQS